MKQWLKRILFPEICFYAPNFSKNDDSDLPSTRWYWVYILFKSTMFWPLFFLDDFGLHLGCFYCILAVYHGGYLYSYNQKRMEYLMTIPYPWQDYAKGRFLCSVLTGFIATLPLIPLFTTNATNDALQWGLSQPLAFSQVLAFMLTSFSLFIVTFAATILVRTRLSQVGFLWIFAPLMAVFFGVLYLSYGVSLNWRFWLEYIKLPMSLAILVLSLGLTALLYWWTAKSLARWEVPKKVPVRKKILRTAAVLMVLALVAGLVWKSNRYVSPVDESLSPEEQYQVAVQCQEEGDIYGAAVAFYACGDYADARERCWEMWGQIVPRSTVALTGRQVVALTEDGGILVSIPPDAEPYFTADEIDAPQELVSIHGGSSFLVGLYADGTVGLFGEYPEEWREIIAGWHDIVELYVGHEYFDGYIAGLRSDGTPVLCFGNSGDKLEDDERDRLLDQTNLRAMGAGRGRIAALHADGRVTAYDDVGVTHGVALWSDVVAVNAGFGCTFGLRADGTVYSGGDNSWGQCNVQQWSDIVAIDAEYFCTAGLRRDGTVLVTGDLVGKSDLDQTVVAQWREITDVILSGNLLVGLRTDGTLVATGDTELIQAALDDWENIRLPG